ncbi:energy transducer TonB [Pelagicoccus mobilis]|uniref:TonB family protein n=1 Tax=Pelagicoccus mobilis TaxID=415221 RepID=A0A934S462_9BACT|nr:energy transducer TonB [Pelagicoccus mobilis]MBK1879054.1 TonB family protein [Pelagicoccus mobilis]
MFLLPWVAYATVSAPTPKKTVAPHLSSELDDDAGEVRVLVDVNEYGFVIDAQIWESSNKSLNQVTLDAIHQWTFEPAKENGSPVSSRLIQPFYFNRGSIVLKEKKTPQDTHPIAKNTVKPKLDSELKHITGKVVLMASLNSKGGVSQVSVQSSTHSELEDSAAAALKNWKFKPATEAGTPVASKVIIPFHFKASGQSRVVAAAKRNKSLDTPAFAIRQRSPEIPRHLTAEQAATKLRLTVDEFGYVANVKILESSNDALSEAAQNAALQWKFKPAMKNGKAVASTVEQPFTFNGGLLAADVPVDKMPEVKRTQQPRIPDALALVQGYVKVRVSLDDRGNVVNASVAKSSHDELVGPTIEAAKKWSFKPAIRGGERVPSSVTIPFVFNEQT